MKRFTPLKLYRITVADGVKGYAGYDTYSGAIVAAKSR